MARNANTLNDFRRVARGFAHARYFSLNFEYFQGLRDLGPSAKIVSRDISSVLNVYARSFALPGAVMNPKPVTLQHGQPAINIADNVVFSPWTATFIDDDTMTIRNLFEMWMDAIRSFNDHGYATPNKYKAPRAAASLLTHNRIPSQSYEFFGMFPTDLSPITVAQGDTGLVEFSVTFYYDFYRKAGKTDIAGVEEKIDPGALSDNTTIGNNGNLQDRSDSGLFDKYLVGSAQSIA